MHGYQIEDALFLWVSKQWQEIEKGKTPQSLEAGNHVPGQHRKEMTAGHLCLDGAGLVSLRCQATRDSYCDPIQSKPTRSWLNVGLSSSSPPQLFLLEISLWILTEVFIYGMLWCQGWGGGWGQWNGINGTGIHCGQELGCKRYHCIILFAYTFVFFHNKVVFKKKTGGLG